jgi:carbamoyl-phosphate synthase large subunit
MKKLVIGVTGLNAIDSPGPGVAVIRAIRDCADLDVRIIGLSYEALEPGLYMHDLIDKTYQIPYPSGGSDSLLDRLEYIHSKENLDLIIPNFDAELFNFIKLKDVLKSMGIHTFLPDYDQFELRQKLNLSEFGKKFGFYVPEDRIIHDLYELKNLQKGVELRDVQSTQLNKGINEKKSSASQNTSGIEELKYPIVAKGKFYDAYICNAYEDIEKAFHKLNAKWGLPIILQEFIKGTEINIAALGDGKGNAISVIPMRKLYITDKGKAWSGITIEDESLIALAEKFIKSTKWRGGCELEVMLTSDGKPYIMEINPRFPAWIYLTAASGQNQPASLVKMTMGMNVDSMKEYEVGKIFVRYSWDLITDVKEFQKISGSGEL